MIRRDGDVIREVLNNLSDSDLEQLDAIAYAYRCAPREKPEEVATCYYRLARFIDGLIAEARYQERCDCSGEGF